MSTLDLCEKLFGTRDLYKLLQVERNAAQKDIKKAYYKLSLQVHPDRVPKEEKEKATEKFKVLSKIHQVLSETNSRALYDEQGIFDDGDELESKLTSWLDLWRKIFKPLTEEDIDNYQKSYIDSELERKDIKKAYLSGNGCINSMMEAIPFMKVEDEPRIQKIVREMISAGEVPEYKIFTEESAQKRKRRHKKYMRESLEAAEISAQLKTESSLKQQMEKRLQSREASFNSLIDRLSEKYGNDDSEPFDPNSGNKKSKKRKPAQNKKSKVNAVKSGRVKKSK